MRTIVDLSHPLSNRTPAYPGDHVSFSSRSGLTHEHDGCALAVVTCATHTGTHLDAPLHFVPGATPVDALDLSNLIAPLHLLDLRALVAGTARRALAWTDLAPWHGRIAACGAARGVLVLRTGWSVHFSHEELDRYVEHPFLTRDAAQGIVRAGVRVLGVDTFSPDPIPGGDSPAHIELLGATNPCAIVENLRLEGLDDVWNEGEEWTISVLPLNLLGLDGSPVRAVAWKEHSIS